MFKKKGNAMTVSTAIRKSLVCTILGTALSITGCAASGGMAQTTKSNSDDMASLTALYHRTTLHEVRSQRAPVVQERERAMKLLAAKTDEILAETATWDTDARLVGLNAERKSDVHTSVTEFRDSLAGLKSAAAAGSSASVHTNYARVMDRYQRVLQVTATEK